MFNTESQCSSHRLLQGVTVDSGESFLQILKDSPCLEREIEAKNQLSMYSTAYRENFKMSKNIDCLSLFFLLPIVNDSGESIFQYFEYENSMNIRRKFEIASTVTRVSRLMKNENKKNPVGLSL